MDFRILLLGDTVGAPGRRVIVKKVAPLVASKQIDFVVVNAENIAGGSGVTPEAYQEMRKAGVDVMTGGDHIYKKKEVFSILEKEDRLLRPANYPDEAVGPGWCVVPAHNGVEVGVLHILGRVFMQPAECPFKTADKAILAMRSKTKIILVDIHGEATSEKIALGRYLDGRVSAVVGSHTHVQTADEQILPKGTAYLTDLGMTGPYDSVLGRRVDRVLHKFLTQMPAHFDVAEGDVKACGAIVTVDTASGRAKAIERVQWPENGN